MGISVAAALVALVAVVAAGGWGVHGQFIGFYGISCPRAEASVTQVVTDAFQRDPTIAAALVRLLFHDCFVQGCDASILLDNPGGEKSAVPNQTVRGYEVIDDAKAAVEAICPGVVSCADIVALAARDSVVLTGGPTWLVPTGRRDGRVSNGLAATVSLPLPTLTTPVLTQIFLSHGLTQDEMITLSGAHTIGRAHCSAFSNRLALNDPTLDSAYAAELRAACPSANSQGTVPLDPTTPFTFDNNYFTNLAANRGLLTSDQDLFNNLGSQFLSNLDSTNANLWQLKFTSAMVRLSTLNLKIGALGEIRKNCRATN
ncbi:hypothetical protein GOP47_0011428 [Adiantum capillus-veneris]|uniref:Peroxidase n=1 Tax=Adiantum capillus-veneris TaxID=13818 RepID=A0A9D4UT86_ADICA|nr:hypothetical protein GOP47_0011428 [Adiantum capillus-veneris]